MIPWTGGPPTRTHPITGSFPAVVNLTLVVSTPVTDSQHTQGHPDPVLTPSRGTLFGGVAVGPTAVDWNPPSSHTVYWSPEGREGAGSPLVETPPASTPLRTPSSSPTPCTGTVEPLRTRPLSHPCRDTSLRTPGDDHNTTPSPTSSPRRRRTHSGGGDLVDSRPTHREVRASHLFVVRQ